MGEASLDVVPAARTLSHDPDEVNHVVCCRRTWDTTLCGMSAEHVPVNLSSRFICAMCLEVAMREYGGPLDDGVCPLDKTRCPDEAEIDVRISWEIS